MSKKPIMHRVIAIVGGGAFLGSTALAITSIFREALTQPVSSEATATKIEDRLAAQERGYEKVLQREPQNQVALEGLVSVRLQRKDGEGAIKILERLVNLYPDRSDYKILLDRMKQGTERESSDSYGEGVTNQ